MPVKNVVKIDLPESYYHIYARGHNKMTIFRDDEDYRVFFNLTKRYLGTVPITDNRGREYPNLSMRMELICYSIMPNHFHFLIYQIEKSTMSKYMHNILMCYSRYFNKKYELRGSVFETTFKASIINSESYMIHISRYIHLNPSDWQTNSYSSLKYYQGKKHPDWIKPSRIMDMFASAEEYINFLKNYEQYKIESELANN